MEHKTLVQLLSDFSTQSGETYEQRAISDSEFDNVASAIIKLYETQSLEKK